MEGLKVEQAEALSSILDDLSECNNIQANNIQTLVSCPRPPHHPLPRPPSSPKLRHLAEGDFQKNGCVRRHQRPHHLPEATRA